jgi:hypothetical protein
MGIFECLHLLLMGSNKLLSLSIFIFDLELSQPFSGSCCFVKFPLLLTNLPVLIQDLQEIISYKSRRILGHVCFLLRLPRYWALFVRALLNLLLLHIHHILNRIILPITEQISLKTLKVIDLLHGIMVLVHIILVHLLVLHLFVVGLVHVHFMVKLSDVFLGSLVFSFHFDTKYLIKFK